jgi:hypothetical protein
MEIKPFLLDIGFNALGITLNDSSGVVFRSLKKLMVHVK